MAISEQILHPTGDVVEPAAVVVAAAPAPVVMAPAPLAPVASVPEPAPLPTPVPAPAPLPIPAPAPADDAAVLIAIQDTLQEVAAPAAPTFGCRLLRLSASGWDLTKCAARTFNGIRTLLFFVVTGGIFITAKVTDTNTAAFLSKLIGGHVSPEDLLMGMSFAGMALRFITQTPVFDRWRKAAKGGMVISDSDGGSVDEGE